LNIQHTGQTEDNEATVDRPEEVNVVADSPPEYEVSLCPLGHISTENKPCEPCPEGTTTLYRGSSKCVVITEEDLLNMFYGLMDGDNWSEQQRMHWKSDLPACDWEGISCALNREINGIAFPLIGLKTEEDITNWHV